MARQQINDRTRAFIDESGMRDHLLFLADPGSALIASIGILKPDPEPIEAGVPHPTTLLLDRDGVVRFVDVRSDFHIWLAPEHLTRELAKIP